MKFLCLPFLVFFLNSFGFGQNLPDEMKVFFINNSSSNNNLGFDILLNQSQEIENIGTKSLIYEIWTNGIITTKNSEIIEIDSLNINFDADLIIACVKDSIYRLPIYSLESVKLGNDLFLPMAIADKINDNNNLQIVQLIFSIEDFKVFQYFYLDKEIEQSNSPLGIKSTNPKIIFKSRKKLVYTCGESNLAFELPQKKASFYSIFGNEKDLIYDYSKSNKLSHKKVDDLKQIFLYYSKIKN